MKGIGIGVAAAAWLAASANAFLFALLAGTETSSPSSGSGLTHIDDFNRADTPCNVDADVSIGADYKLVKTSGDRRPTARILNNQVQFNQTGSGTSAHHAGLIYTGLSLPAQFTISGDITRNSDTLCGLMFNRQADGAFYAALLYTGTGGDTVLQFIRYNGSTVSGFGNIINSQPLALDSIYNLEINTLSPGIFNYTLTGSNLDNGGTFSGTVTDSVLKLEGGYCGFYANMPNTGVRFDNLAIIVRDSFEEDFSTYIAGDDRLDQQSTDWVLGTGKRLRIVDFNGQNALRPQTGETSITYVHGKTFWPNDGAVLDINLDYTQSGPGDWFGLVFNYESLDNYHVLRSSPDAQRIQLSKIMSGSTVVIFDEPFTSGPGEGTMSLMFNPRSEKVAVYVEGAANTFFKEVANTTLINGAVGIYSSGTCNNFYVRSFSAHADRVKKQLVTDRHFQRGLFVRGVERFPVTIEGMLQRVADNGTPRFTLSQWWSKESIYGTTPTTLPSGALQWENQYKRVTLGPRGTPDEGLSLYIDTFAEYNNNWHVQGDPWPHLAVNQRIADAVTGEHLPWLSELERVDFHIEALLKEADHSREEGYDSSIHVSFFNLSFTIQNLNRESPGHGDFFWFSMKLYDDRYKMPGFSYKWDAGTDEKPGTGKFIYQIGLPFTDTGLTVGEWNTISGDLLPYIITGFNLARDVGALPDSGDLADYRFGGMGMGWESGALSRVGMQVRNLDVSVVRGTTPALEPIPAAPTGLVASASGSGEITLTWNDNSDNETRFDIIRRIGSDGWKFLDSVTFNTTSYVDTGLRADTLYSYRVRARNASGNSEYTITAATTTEQSYISITWLESAAGGSTAVPVCWRD